MPSGKIRFYDDVKGFGFIQTLEGEQVFFHKSVLPQGFTPRPGAKVEFSVVDGHKGQQVLQLTVVEEPLALARRNRKEAEELVPVVEDVIRLLDGASESLRRGKFPDNSAKIAQVLRAVGARFSQ